MNKARGVLTPCHNGQATARDEIRTCEFADFRQTVLEQVAAGRRVAAFFGTPTTGAAVELWVVLADDAEGWLHVARSPLEGDHFESLTPDCPQVHWFEREIAEQWGIRPEGHPWLKPIRFHSSHRPGHDAWGRTEPPVVGVTDFYRVEGEEVHEVAVGPVHAGVIEPGHFRFQCHGENVFHLEISLGYQHRGVERALVGGPNKRSIHFMETLAGDTTIGHATAYCQVMEALADCQAPPRAQALRGMALELERLANHVGDLGALAGDVGYLPTQSFCGRLRGDFLNLTAALCGSRFGRGLVRPGGVGFDLDRTRATQAEERLAAALRDVTEAVGLLWDTPSVQGRFEGTGTVSRELCEQLGLVGPAARACGCGRDVRQDFPTGIYCFGQIPVSLAQTGDVFARAFVRSLEVQRSAAFIQEQLHMLPGGPTATALGPLAPDHFAVALVEGWRGEIAHIALTDADGRFARYKVIDPSFHNWMGLAVALRGQQISDFPLCNKSFNLSYCGHDL
jgi:Ni,Fe-hydrogenase III large subunit